MKPRAAKLALLVCAVMLVSPTPAQKHKPPITENGLIEALKTGGLSQAELIQRIKERGVNFVITGNTERELRGAGATSEIIEACRHHLALDALIPEPDDSDGWQLALQSPLDDAFYCKPEGIKRAANGRLRTWIRHRWFGAADDGGHDLIFEEFDCPHNTIRLLASLKYNSNGDVTESDYKMHTVFRTDRDDVFHDFEPLLKFVCSNAVNRH